MSTDLRRELSVSGLQPVGVQPLAAAASNALEYIRELPTPLARYQALVAMQRTNANLFYYLLQNVSTLGRLEGWDLPRT